MKYMQSGGFQKNPFMRTTLLWTAVFLAGLWLTNFAMYFARMNLSPETVRAYYLGSEAAFTPPRSYGSMLETTHAHLPIMAVVVLLLTHLLIFAPFADRAKRLSIHGSFAAALIQEASGWLVRFVHPGFAWLKIAAFIALQSALGFLLFALAAFLIEEARASPHPRRHAKELD